MAQMNKYTRFLSIKKLIDFDSKPMSFFHGVHISCPDILVIEKFRIIRDGNFMVAVI